MPWWMIVLVMVLLTPLLLPLLAYGWIEWRTADRRYQQVEAVPVMQVGLVLGTSPYYRNGEPNAYFQRRIEAAAELFLQGKVSQLLLSGSAEQAWYNEPEEMAAALEQKGVPRERMILDTEGVRTYDSVSRLHAVYQFESCVIVSQGFHNARALYLADKQGVTAVAYDADSVRNQLGVKTPGREYLARVKALYDVWLR